MTNVTVTKHSVTADERLYTNVERTKVLKEGEKGADILLAPKGGEIPTKLAEKLGLLKKEKEKEKEPEDHTHKGPVPLSTPHTGPKGIDERKTRA